MRKLDGARFQRNFSFLFLQSTSIEFVFNIKTKMAKRVSSKLFVSRLSSFTTKQGLEKLFSPFGVVTEARLIKDPKTQRTKGFGFVSFQSESEAQKALKALNGRIVDGRLIFVEVAKSETSGNDA